MNKYLNNLFSNKEKNIMKNLKSKGYNYIVRNKDDSLWAFKEQPRKNFLDDESIFICERDDIWYSWYSDTTDAILSLPQDLFYFISWDDLIPFKISFSIKDFKDYLFLEISRTLFEFEINSRHDDDGNRIPDHSLLLEMQNQFLNVLNKLKDNWDILTEDSDVPVDEYAKEYWEDLFQSRFEDEYVDIETNYNGDLYEDLEKLSNSKIPRLN